METKAEQLPDLEVVVTCTKCGKEHIPLTTEAALKLNRCAKCGRAPFSREEASPEAREFAGSVERLRGRAFNVSEALRDAIDKAKVLSDVDNTQFKVSIRVRE